MQILSLRKGYRPPISLSHYKELWLYFAYLLQLSLHNFLSFILLMISNRIAEFQAKLFDPRSYSWRVKESESESESVFVRPILLRTLSLSAAADAAYRQYESPDALVPPLPCTPVPLSK